jgi:predicted component of type VI protein secretion system
VAQERELDDLPAYTHVLADGERELQACAEVFLSEQVLDGLLSSGLMPLASHRHRNAATLAALAVGGPAATGAARAARGLTPQTDTRACVPRVHQPSFTQTAGIRSQAKL